MPQFFYSVRKLFKGDPSNVAELRAAQSYKFSQLFDSGKKGTFWITLAAKPDGLPAITFSETGSAQEKAYTKLADPNPKANGITGKFDCDKKLKTVKLTVDDSCKRTLADYQKHKDFEILIYNFFVGLDLNQLSFEGRPLTKRKMGDAEWEVCQYDLSRALTNLNRELTKVEKGGLLTTPPLKGSVLTQGSEKVFSTEMGILIPVKITISVTIYGKMVEKAIPSPDIAAFLREPVSELMAKHSQALKTTIIDLEKGVTTQASADKEKVAFKRAVNRVRYGIAAQAAVNKAIADFQATFEPAVVKAVTEQWMIHVESHVIRRDYQINCAIKIVTGSITVALGTASAAVGGLTGIGAVLGLIGTIKGATELLSTIYTTFRSVDDLGKELNKTVLATLEDYCQKDSKAGWKDFGKNVLGKIPAVGAFTKAVGGKLGAKVKSVKDLSSDVDAYKGKVSGLMVDAQKLGKTVNAVLDETQKALAALDSKEVKEAEKSLEGLKKSNDLKRDLIGKKVTDLLNEIGDLYQRFLKGRDNYKSYDECIGLMKTEVSKDKVAVFLDSYLTPMLEMPWGVDPSNLQSTLRNVGTVCVNLTSQLLQDAAKMGDTGAKTADWIAWINDSANWAHGIAGSIK